MMNNKPEPLPQISRQEVAPIGEPGLLPPVTVADPGSYCPNCGSRMRESRCKLSCKTCGFFLSCSDFY